MPNATSRALLLAAAIASASGNAVHAQAPAPEFVAAVPADTLPPLDNLWWDGFERVTPFDGPIVRTLNVGSDLVVSGEFSRVHKTSARRIARWDGVQWNALAAGLDAVPRSMIVYDGQLAVGDQHRVRLWTGTQWNDLEAGASPGDLVRRLFVHEGRLLASFHRAGLRSYDGSTWTTIAFPGAHAVILALATYQGDLYAGGNFAALEGAASPNIARWDGAKWHAVGSGTPGRVEQLAVQDGTLLVGGSFLSIDQRPIANLARWNGVEWSSCPGGYFADLFEAEGQLFGVKASNRGSVHLWTGSDWQPYERNGMQRFTRIHTGTTHQGTVLLSATAVDPLDGVYHHLFSHSGGTNSLWFPINPVIHGQGLDGPTTVMLSRTDGVIVGGSFGRTGDVIVAGFQRWDGDAWHAFAPYPPGPTRALLEFQGEVVAAGRFTSGLHGIARWDGSAWRPFGTGLRNDVRSLAVYQGDLIAGGQFSRSGDTQLRNIARWDGAAWQPLGEGLSSNQNGVLAMTVWDGKLVATSRTSASGGLVSAWDGVQWTQLGDTWEAQGLANFNGQLYASSLRYRGGTFRLARWNGVEWFEVPSPRDVGTKLLVYGSRLVQGNWTWNGTQWARLASGITGSIAAMVEFDRSLYAGGNFQRAGGKQSFYIARYDGASLPLPPMNSQAKAEPAATPPSLSARELANGAVEIGWSNVGSPTRCELFDVRGRRVAALPLCGHAEHGTLRWNRRGTDGVPVARGAYLLRMQAGEHTLIQKLVLLHTARD